MDRDKNMFPLPNSNADIELAESKAFYLNTIKG